MLNVSAYGVLKFTLTERALYVTRPSITLNNIFCRRIEPFKKVAAGSGQQSIPLGDKRFNFPLLFANRF